MYKPFTAFKTPSGGSIAFVQFERQGGKAPYFGFEHRNEKLELIHEDLDYPTFAACQTSLIMYLVDHALNFNRIVQELEASGNSELAKTIRSACPL